MAWLYWGEIDGDTAVARGEEARHAVRVARIRLGERISIGNGAGVIATGVVTAVGDELIVTVEERQEHQPPPVSLCLAQALAKGDRDELAIQAATELGVARVIPWQAERSVSRWDRMKAEKGQARWRSIVREAAKQAIRPIIPDVGEVAGIRELAAREGLLLVLDPTAPARISEISLPATGDITLVVGPEGGISERELALLSDAGGVRVRLGSEILRTSTAGPAALSALNLRLGRW